MYVVIQPNIWGFYTHCTVCEIYCRNHTCTNCVGLINLFEIVVIKTTFFHSLKSLKYFLDKQHSQIIVVIADLPMKSFYCT